MDNSNLQGETMGVLNRIVKEIIVIGFLCFFMSLLGLREGIGYWVSAVTVKSTLIVRYDVDLGGGYDQGLGYIAYSCDVTIHLNPIIYPITYILKGGKTSATVNTLEGPILNRYGYYRATESAKFATAFSEFFGLNILYIIAMSFLIERALFVIYRKHLTWIED